MEKNFYCEKLWLAGAAAVAIAQTTIIITVVNTWAEHDDDDDITTRFIYLFTIFVAHYCCRYLWKIHTWIGIRNSHSILYMFKIMFSSPNSHTEIMLFECTRSFSTWLLSFTIIIHFHVLIKMCNTRSFFCWFWLLLLLPLLLLWLVWPLQIEYDGCGVRAWQFKRLKFNHVWLWKVFYCFFFSSALSHNFFFVVIYPLLCSAQLLFELIFFFDSL